MIRLTREFAFESAHALGGYDGPCREIHGHSYRLFVTVCGEPNRRAGDAKEGMVMDFGELKRIVNEQIVAQMDHSLVLRRDPRGQQLAATLADHGFDNIVLTDYQPTCENLLYDFAARLRGALPEGVSLHSLRLHETASSCAEWFAADN